MPLLQPELFQFGTVKHRWQPCVVQRLRLCRDREASHDMSPLLDTPGPFKAYQPFRSDHRLRLSSE